MIGSTLSIPGMNHFCILGAPGSGKTTALVGRIAKAVEETRYGGDVIICSLTRTAAHEIAERVKARIPNVEFPHVGTVHALALRALKAIGENPRLIYEEEHVNEFNKQFRRKLPLNLGNTLFDPEGSNVALQLLADSDRRRAAEQPHSHWPAATERFFGQWTTFKELNGLMDFTDLIIRAIAVCKAHPADPRFIFVDEAQDLSRLEMRLIQQWSETTEKTIIAGDDQQALYEWRGASVIDFIAFAPEENRYVLPRSYRMTREVYNTARQFGDRISLKVPKEFSPVGEGGSVVHQINFNLISKIKADMLFGNVMLIASCGYMLNPYLKDLRREGVPFHNPYRSRAEGKTWNPLSSRHADAYRCFLMPSEGQQMWTWPQLWKVAEQLDPSRYLEFMKMVKKNKNNKGTVPPDAIDPYHLDEFLTAAQAGDYNTYFRMLSRASKFGTTPTQVTPMSYIKRVLDNYGKAGIDDTPRLIVGTIHSVKGGEADIVYLLPYISPEAHRSMASKSGKDSVLRTFYVGTSRAKHKLVLVRDPQNRRCMWV